MKKRTVRNTIVIGSGPAGYTAAIYLARAQLSPLLFGGDEPGGQLTKTTQVENFPGFSEGILGLELMETMGKQAVRFGAEIIGGSVKRVNFSKTPFQVEVHEGGKTHVYFSKTVIIATGARARMLGVGEERLLGRGVSTCAVCDAAFYKDKVTYVVGGGDAAMEEALALIKFAKSVTLIHRKDQLRASKIMQKRVLEDHKDKVKVLWNSQVTAVAGEQKLQSITVEDVQKGSKKRFESDGLFLAIGHLPVTDIFQGQIGLDKKGYIVTRFGLEKKSIEQANSHINEQGLLEYPTMTSVEGVFAAGDVVDFSYRQAITAAGFGCMAALDAEQYLTGSQQSW
jgi:thioredoxin reductase (NADPH)